MKAGFWDRFDAEWDKIHRSTIVILADASLPGGIDACKVYINGFIHGTGARFRDVAPPHSVYTRVRSGAYRIIVREYDARKPNRLESNALEITLQDDQQITLVVAFQNGQITLAPS